MRRDNRDKEDNNMDIKYNNIEINKIIRVIMIRIVIIDVVNRRKSSAEAAEICTSLQEDMGDDKDT